MPVPGTPWVAPQLRSVHVRPRPPRSPAFSLTSNLPYSPPPSLVRYGHYLLDSRVGNVEPTYLFNGFTPPSRNPRRKPGYIPLDSVTFLLRNYFAILLAHIPDAHGLPAYFLAHLTRLYTLVADNTPVSLRDIPSPDGLVRDSEATINYHMIDRAVSDLIASGPGSLMLKLDLESAFRHIPVRREDWHLVGFTWEEKFYHDLQRCTGPFSATFLLIFTTTSTTF
ncbi:hypothetical protein B0H19DRAFT_1260505 [Mycena capillaripes]|nr:hypothetical protein B0H19DRAFT_1260505 [Mycena capillaripes]